MTGRSMVAGRDATKNLVVTNLAVGLAAGFLVAWIDWGGVDRSLSDRVLAGFFALQGAMALATGLQFRSIRHHPSWMAAEMCAAAGSACLTVAMLASGLTAFLFGVAGVVGIAFQIRNFREYKRSVIASRTAAP